MTSMAHRTSIRAAVAAMVGTLLLTALGWAAAPPLRAATTITVNTINQEVNGDGFCSLQEAIYAANLDDSIAPDVSNPGQFFDTACPGGSGHDVIELPYAVFQFSDPITEDSNFMGPTATPMITTPITIEGRGARLERLAAGRETRLFAVNANGFLDLREVHVKGFAIRGGDGGIGGGGGGMGAGGAIYVQAGRLLIQWSTFEGNAVRGGNGGAHLSVDGGGGGGGLSGNGGAGDFSGGGGGGARGNGGAGRTIGGDYWGGGGGGRVTSGVNETPGEPCGAAGGESTFAIGGDGDSADSDCPGGGGGGGSGSSDILPGDGGTGSYGGGGGGGGGGAAGGDGGFGAGGGGGGNGFTYTGGDGGFGGGGGQDDGIGLSDGQGGTFAGDASMGAGGGGAGLGGAIFGYLAEIEVSNSTFFGNEAAQGQAGVNCGSFGCSSAANDGRGAGGAIFTVAGDLTVASSTFSGNGTVTVTNGGGGAIVVYDPIGDDEATFELRNTILAGNGSHECYTRNGVDTGGSDGNIITSNTDSNTPDSVPCVGVDSPDDPGLGLLDVHAPGRTPTMPIGPGSNAINAAVGTSPLDDQRGVARPQGAGADIGAYEYEAPAALAPVTTIALTPSSPNGSNDWYTSAVGVSVSATDFDGDLAETRCALDPSPAPGAFGDLAAGCSVTSVAADGDHAVYAASVDAAGNEESPVVSAAFRIDATDPVLAPSLNVPNVVIGQAGVEVNPNATDATSGVASASCDPVDTSVVGAQTIDCTATDNAGNVGSASLVVTIEYQILGFFSPVPLSKWKAGQTVPVKIALADGDGVRIGDAEAAALAADCLVTFSASGVQTVADKCLKYDAANDQFIFNWKLKKSPLGSTTITVAVAYEGSTVETTLSSTIEIIR